MGVENKIIVGEIFPAKNRNAYAVAVTEGMIDPTISERDFYKMCELTDDLDTAPDLESEYKVSELKVANFFRDGQSRKKVIREWFGK